MDGKNEINGRVAEYVDLFQQIKEQVGDDQVAMGLVTEVSKDRRVQQLREERRGDKPMAVLYSEEQPATPKQLEFLKDLGLRVPRNVTKRRASEMLDEALAKEAA